MKKIPLFFVVVLFGLNVQATIFTVTVTSFQFSPNNIPNVVVGDIIRFVWGSGFHTTTCDPANNGSGNSLPPGALPWNTPINSGSTTFDYTVTVAGNYKYWCNFHQPNMAGSFTATNPTPVTLSEFKVGTINNKPALSWKTSTEINTSYFSVRKSNDGTNYAEIGRLPAAGTSNTERSYSFTDNNVSKNEKYVYYLLATMDIDGSKKFSETRIFKNPLAIPKLITSISPNPISKPGHLLLQFNADKAGAMLVRVVNTQGKAVVKVAMDAFPGINNGHVHLGDLPPGTYSIQFNLQGIMETHKVVVK